ncbi:MAG: nicotinate-nucleotide adenylyltransferase [Pyrinomonadaceae bacterium]
MKRRIALYGGTFDPVHLAHLEVARRLLELFALDEVLFIPACVAPHKRRTIVSPALHRYAMLSLATQDDERLRVSTIELDAPGKPYTVDTLQRMQETFGERVQLFFVMGADSWAEIATWHEWERVLAISNHIVVTRPGYQVETSRFAPGLRERIVDVRQLDQGEIGARVNGGGAARIYITDAVMADVSATSIRASARAGRVDELLKFVPRPVADYITKYGLYKNE